MKPSQLLICLFLFVSLFSGCYRNEKTPKTSSQAKLSVPGWGITIDANYDKSLDNLVKGYKILTVAITNRSVDMIKLDQLRDQWFIEDAWGRKLKAINSLRVSDPKSWADLPAKVQDLLEYPAGVQIGFSQTFDLFFPSNTELHRFRSIGFYSSTLKQKFEAISSASLERAVPAVDGGESDSSDSPIRIPSRSPKILPPRKLQKIETSEKSEKPIKNKPKKKEDE